MKNKLPQFLLVLVVALLAITFFYFQNEKELSKQQVIIDLRKQHEYFLANSPFKKTLQLSKSQRKAQGIPPNKYYEREWELTMNPATGFPEPNKVLALQKERNSTLKRAPGDGDVTNNWVDRGPNNVGGRTRVVFFDPNDADKNRVFAGGVSGGLWVNEDITNANSSWALVEGVPGNMNISCITVDPNNSQIWYIGTGEQYMYGAAVGNGVYKTTNGGNNWVNVHVQLAGGGNSGNDFAGLYFINDIIAWDNAGSTVLFLGVGTTYYRGTSPLNWLGNQNTGLYTSLDQGVNWSRIESANLELTVDSPYYVIPNDFEISADNKIWMGSIGTPTGSNGGGKVFSSVDGNAWTLVKSLANSNRVELAVSKTNANIIYALTQGTTSSNPPHIYATTDAFVSVTELAKPDAVDVYISANDFTRGQAWYNLMIEVDPTNDQVFYVGGIDLFRTEQGTNTNSPSDWKQISKWSNNNNMAALSCSLVHADQHAFAFRPGNSNEAIIGNDGGIYYALNLDTANDNAAISARNKDYNVTQFYYGGYGQSISNELIIAGAQDNGSQFINGAVYGTNSSIAVYGGDGAYCTIDKDGDYMIASYLYNQHFYFMLPYTGAYEYKLEKEDAPQQGDFINQAGLDHNLNIFYSNGGSGKINRYILGSYSADKIQLTNLTIFPGGSPTAFKVSPHTTASTTLLVGTDNNKLLKLTNANATTIWASITVPFVGSVSDIEFGTSENEIYVTIHNYGVTSVWYTADGGATWENKEGNLPDMPVKCILPNPLVANEVIIGTELGIWTTKNFNDASPNWVSAYNGMRDVKVVDLDLRTADNSILATTHGRGVFTGKFSKIDFTISSQNNKVTTCTPTAAFDFNYHTFSENKVQATFSATDVPSGVSASFNPTSLSSSDVFSLTLNNVNSLSAGEYPIKIRGNGLISSEIEVILKVVNPSTINIVTTTAPINKTTDVAIEGVDFNWNAIAEATSYDIDISTDSGFSNIIESENVLNNAYVLVSTLNSGTVYYWRVRAVNDCVMGDFSEVRKFQTQYNCNIYSNNTLLAIPDGLSEGVDGTPATSVINIPSNFLISDLNITVNISHTYVGDLKISLLSPNNTEVVLHNFDGCAGEDNIRVVFDDAASTTINCGSLIQETVRSLNPLSAFNNENAQGNWTLTIVDNWSNDFGTLNSWAIEACENKTITNSSLINNPIIVGTNNFYIVKSTDIEASSAGSTNSQQVFMLTQLPAVGTLKLNDVALLLGQTFTQADINNSLLTYVNTGFVTTFDSFKVDVTNATSGFLPNQQIDITIDSALNLRDDFLAKSGISIYPTISNGYFSIASTKAIGKMNIEIYAMTGQLVFTDQLDFSFGNLSHINANRFAPGVYILKIKAENIQGTKKIVIK